MAMTIGCIGLGVFGARVAARLSRQGFGVMIYDSWTEPVRYFLLKNTGDMGESPRMLAALCDVVVAVLPDAKAMRDVALGRLGLVEGLKDGKTCLLLDLGTTSARDATALAADLAPRGIHYIEAPARGTPIDAREGRLTIPVGGEAQLIERAMPVLRALGQTITPTGAVGSAHLMSALVEHARASAVLAVAEAVAIGKAAGVSPKALRQWCAAEGLIAPAVASLMDERPTDSGHTIETLLDNLRSLTALARANSLSPRHADLLAAMWGEAGKALGVQRDIAEIGRFLERDMLPRPPVAKT